MTGVSVLVTDFTQRGALGTATSREETDLEDAERVSESGHSQTVPPSERTRGMAVFLYLAGLIAGQQS